MPINTRIDKLYYSHTMEYSSALKWNIYTSNNTKEFSKYTEQKKKKRYKTVYNYVYVKS